MSLLGAQSQGRATSVPTPLSTRLLEKEAGSAYAAAVSDQLTRVAVAAGAGLLLGIVLLWLGARRLGRPNLVLTGYAATVAVLGVFAILGTDAAVLAGTVIVGAFVLGAVVYGLLALAGRWARGD